MSNTKVNSEYHIKQKRLFIKHLVLRVLIITNGILLFFHCLRFFESNSRLDSALHFYQMPFSSSLNRSPILREALAALVVEEFADKRFEVIWEAWRFLSYQERYYAIEQMVNQLDKIESTESRIYILNQIKELSPKWKKCFIRKYNFDHLDIPDPFAEIASNYQDIITANQWQITNEIKYLAYAHHYGLNQRYCLMLEAPSYELQKLCNELLNLHKNNSTNQLGYHALVMYFMNWPVDMPLDREMSFSHELIESCVTEAYNCLVKFNLVERADTLLKQLDAFLEK